MRLFTLVILLDRLLATSVYTRVNKDDGASINVD